MQQLAFEFCEKSGEKKWRNFLEYLSSKRCKIFAKEKDLGKMKCKYVTEADLEKG